MKIFLKMATLFFVLTTPVIFTACDSGDSGNGGGLTAGDTETYTADGVSYVMSYVPGGLTFPTGINDDGSATVSNAYWIADTEVTYELWEKVYTWAKSGSGATGAGQYTFANAGAIGDGSGDTNKHPVTFVNWRDSMVWCNALTEWYNAQSGTSYECVYTYSSAIIRDSQDSNDTACDGAVAGTTADGFRLLTCDEWDCAARYIDGTSWNGGDHVSGDTTAAYNASSVIGNYAWYDSNSESSTHIVGTAGNADGTARSGNANALGLYDMSGNVWEWCFDLSGSGRVRRGGSWGSSAYYLQVGSGSSFDPYGEDDVTGFRFARTQ